MSSALLSTYIILWIVVVVQGVAIFALYHHFGQMYLNSREGRASQGPPVDEPLRQLTVHDLDQHPLHLPARGNQLLLFMSTTCGPCKRLREELPVFASEVESVEPIILCAGDADTVHRWAEGLSEFLTVIPDPDHRIAHRYDIFATPFLVGVDASGVVRARGLVNERAGLDAAAREVEKSRELVRNGSETRPKQFPQEVKRP